MEILTTEQVRQKAVRIANYWCQVTGVDCVPITNPNAPKNIHEAQARERLIQWEIEQTNKSNFVVVAA